MRIIASPFCLRTLHTKLQNPRTHFEITVTVAQRMWHFLFKSTYVVIVPCPEVRALPIVKAFTLQKQSSLKDRKKHYVIMLTAWQHEDEKVINPALRLSI